MLQKLSLDSAFEDTPETRLMVAIFEQDTGDLLRFMKGLLGCSQKLVSAQQQVTSAVRQLAAHLRSYPTQRLLESDFDVSTIQEFSQTMEELGSWNQAVADQLTESVSAPIHRYIDKELQELITVGKLYSTTADELDHALIRYARASTRQKPELESERVDAAHAAYVCRKKSHQMSLLYFNKMNLLQHSRKLALLDPLLGFVQAFRSFHSIGNGALSASDTEKFLSSASQMSQSVQDEISGEMLTSADEMDSIISQSENKYTVISSSHDAPGTDPSVTLIPSTPPVISGYLFYKTKYLGVMAQWERAYFFTEGCSLMVTRKGQLAGSLCLELDGSTITQPLTGEDRAAVFQISTNTKSVILQALNEQARDQWLVGIGHLLHCRKQPPVPTHLAPSSGRPMTSGSIISGVSQFFIDRLQLRSSGTSESTSQTDSRPAGFLESEAPIMFQLPWTQTAATASTTTTTEAEPPTPDSLECSPQAERPRYIGQRLEARHMGSVQVGSDRGHRLVTQAIDRVLHVHRHQHVASGAALSLQVGLQALLMHERGGSRARTLSLSYSQLSFWAPHLENDRLMGLISVDPDTSRLWCHVLETKAASQQLCSALTHAAAAAYRRQSEAQLLLNNIRLQPDLSPPAAVLIEKTDSSPTDTTQQESEA